MNYLNNVRLETNFYQDETDLTRTATKLVTLAIDQGKIAQIIEQTTTDYPKGEDMEGLLAVPTLKERHNHLDKTYMSLGWRATTPVKSLKERLALEAHELALLAPSTQKRATAMIEQLLSYGVSHIRTHVNIDPYVRLENFYGVKAALEAYQDRITYEIVAFPQHGYFLEDTPQLMEQAMAEGADIVGGLDPAGIDFAIEESIEAMIQLALRYEKGIDIHLHDEGEVGVYTLETLLDQLEAVDFQHEVAISHAFCLNSPNEGQRKELFKRLANQKVQIMSTVPYDLRDRRPPIDELLASGIAVHLGSDGFFDSWSSYVSGDLVEKIKAYSEVTGKITEEGLSQAYQLGCGVKHPFSFESEQFWFRESDPANLLFVPAASTAEFVARRPMKRKIMLQGKWVEQTRLLRY